MGHLSERQRQILHVMGIQTWRDRDSDPGKPPASVRAHTPAPNAGEPPRVQGLSKTPTSDNVDTHAAAKDTDRLQVIANAVAPDVSQLDWQALRKTIASCRLCELCSTRTQTVFGVGNPSADWMLIGEAPGAEEDQRGEPFVGPSGALLDAMMQSVGLDRTKAYIANVLKCRTPGNRDPHVDEMQMCENYLQRQIELVQPKLIVAVGRIAAHKLLSSSDSLARLRGKVHHYGAMKTPVIVTYHPAYLLRSPTHKRKVWEDLLLGASTIARDLP